MNGKIKLGKSRPLLANAPICRGFYLIGSGCSYCSVRRLYDSRTHRVTNITNLLLSHDEHRIKDLQTVKPLPRLIYCICNSICLTNNSQISNEVSVGAKSTEIIVSPE